MAMDDTWELDEMKRERERRGMEAEKRLEIINEIARAGHGPSAGVDVVGLFKAIILLSADGMRPKAKAPITADLMEERLVQ